MAEIISALAHIKKSGDVCHQSEKVIWTKPLLVHSRFT